jgi:hypothetical protein
VLPEKTAIETVVSTLAEYWPLTEDTCSMFPTSERPEVRPVAWTSTLGKAALSWTAARLQESTESDWRVTVMTSSVIDGVERSDKVTVVELPIAMSSNEAEAPTDNTRPIAKVKELSVRV